MCCQSSAQHLYVFEHVKLVRVNTSTSWAPSSLFIIVIACWWGNKAAHLRVCCWQMKEAVKCYYSLSVLKGMWWMATLGSTPPRPPGGEGISSWSITCFDIWKVEALLSHTTKTWKCQRCNAKQLSSSNDVTTTCVNTVSLHVVQLRHAKASIFKDTVNIEQPLIYIITAALKRRRIKILKKNHLFHFCGVSKHGCRAEFLSVNYSCFCFSFLFLFIISTLLKGYNAPKQIPPPPPPICLWLISWSRSKDKRWETKWICSKVPIMGSCNAMNTAN